MVNILEIRVYPFMIRLVANLLEDWEYTLESYKTITRFKEYGHRERFKNTTFSIK